MASIGDLVVRLTANTNPLSQGLNQGRASLASFVGAATRVLAPLATAFGFAKSIEAAQEQNVAMRKLEAVIAATGGAAGITAQQISDLASQMQKTTDFGDEVTISAAAVLATFKSIKGVTFTETLKTAQDLSTVMGQDLQASVVQLGKALEDPIRGITALRRVGVSFTADQQAQIKALHETGKTLEAQSMILSVVQGQFKGAAEAASTPLARFKNLISDVAENIGFALLPSLNAVIERFSLLLKPAQDGVGTFQNLGKSLASLVKLFLDYGQAIASAIVFIAVYRGALLAIAVAQKAVAVGAAIVAALQGPVGWAKLAAGAAAAGIAVGVLTEKFDALSAEVPGVAAEAGNLAPKLSAIGNAADDTAGSVDDLAKRVAALREKFGSSDLQKQLEEINALKSAGGLTGAEAARFSAEARHKASGSVERIQDLRDEIAKLKGTTTEAQIEFRKLMESGATRAQAEGVRNLMQELERIQEQKKQAEEQQAAAKKIKEEQQRFRESVFQEVQTPEEKFRERIAELQRGLAEGAIGKNLFNRAVASAKERFESELKSQEPEKKPEVSQSDNAALQRGSAEAFNAIIAAMNNKQANAQQATANNTKKSNDLLASIKQDMRTVALNATSGEMIESFT